MNSHFLSLRFFGCQLGKFLLALGLLLDETAKKKLVRHFIITSVIVVVIVVVVIAIIVVAGAHQLRLMG